MANILLVDDEFLAIRGLQEGVNWQKCGIDQVYTALSAVKAKKILREAAVDVMICDIEMQGDSGIQLLEWVRDNCPETVTIFLSCHAEFDYAQEAVRLGAFRYLLKPSPYEKIEEVVEEAIRYGKKERLGKELVEKMFPEEALSSGTPVECAKRFILDHLSDECSRESIAEAVHLSPDHLARLFKKEVGMGISDYIIKQRIVLARQLLENADASIGSVAEQTGFQYVAYFSKVFKRETGMTPAEYRKSKRMSEKIK